MTADERARCETLMEHLRMVVRKASESWDLRFIDACLGSAVSAANGVRAVINPHLDKEDR